MIVTDTSATVGSRQHTADWPNSAVDEVLKARESLLLTNSVVPSLYLLRNNHT